MMGPSSSLNLFGAVQANRVDGNGKVLDYMLKVPIPDSSSKSDTFFGVFDGLLWFSSQLMLVSDRIWAAAVKSACRMMVKKLFP